MLIFAYSGSDWLVNSVNLVGKAPVDTDTFEQNPPRLQSDLQYPCTVTGPSVCGWLARSSDGYRAYFEQPLRTEESHYQDMLLVE